MVAGPVPPGRRTPDPVGAHEALGGGPSGRGFFIFSMRVMGVCLGLDTDPHYRRMSGGTRQGMQQMDLGCFGVSLGRKVQPDSNPRVALGPSPVVLPQRHASGMHSIVHNLATGPIPRTSRSAANQVGGIPGLIPRLWRYSLYYFCLPRTGRSPKVLKRPLRGKELFPLNDKDLILWCSDDSWHDFPLSNIIHNMP